MSNTDDQQQTRRQPHISWLEHKIGRMGRKTRTFAHIVTISGKGAILFAIAYAIATGQIDLSPLSSLFGM